MTMSHAEAQAEKGRGILDAVLACPHREPLAPKKSGCSTCSEARCGLGKGYRKGIVSITECSACIVEQQRA